MPESSGMMFVIDDDKSMRHSVAGLVRSVGLQARPFASTSEFREAKRPNIASCLILEVRLPGVNGLDFQRELSIARDHIPVIFLTAYGDIRMAVQAMKVGAVDFLTKPFRNQEVLDAVHSALERDRRRRYREAAASDFRKRLESLTPRERQVFPLLVAGLPNKQIAAEIGISEAAAKVHRSQLMRKLGVGSVAKLVSTALQLEITSLPS
jgi:RNA polymerase sigma factor (sigma-70 family)